MAELSEREQHVADAYAEQPVTNDRLRCVAWLENTFGPLLPSIREKIEGGLGPAVQLIERNYLKKPKPYPHALICKETKAELARLFHAANREWSEEASELIRLDQNSQTED